jgi:hypothetical protein
MMFERGALLLVPFPFTDLSAAKRRPVLALTAPDSYGDFIALRVTSRPDRLVTTAVEQLCAYIGGKTAP